MTPDRIEAERVRFEAWWYDRYGSRTVPRITYFQYLGNGYINERVEGQWVSWLARAEEQYASEAAAEELMEQQEPQRLAMEAKHMGSNGVK